MVVKSQYKTKQAQGHRLAVEGSVLWGDTSRECAEIMEKLHRQSDAGDAPFNSTNVFLS